MVKSSRPRICADCKHWKCYGVLDPEHPEDELGKCEMTDEQAYGDDDSADSCSNFKSGKRPTRRHR